MVMPAGAAACKAAAVHCGIAAAAAPDASSSSTPADRTALK
jgi:hypothetical protein